MVKKEHMAGTEQVYKCSDQEELIQGLVSKSVRKAKTEEVLKPAFMKKKKKKNKVQSSSSLTGIAHQTNCVTRFRTVRTASFNRTNIDALN